MLAGMSMYEEEWSRTEIVTVGLLVDVFFKLFIFGNRN